MKPYRNIFAVAALAFTAASSAFAAPVAYQEAAATWNLQQALRLAPALTPEVIKALGSGHGPDAAAQLAAKQKSVSELLRRYSACDLGPEDKRTAAKYFSKDLRSEINYYADGGCASLKAGETASRPAPRAASLDSVSAFAASGALATAEGSARFFDGSRDGGPADSPVVAAGRSAPSAAYTAPVASGKPLSAKVPELRAPAPEKKASAVPEGLARDGMVNNAVDYWAAMRKENRAAIEKGGLEGAEKAKAYAKAAAAAGLGGLLIYSNLPNVETAAARMRWAIKNDAGGKVVAAETGKFMFHSGVFILALAPIPLVKVAQAALAGEVWALAVIGAIAAGPIDRYITHIADVKRRQR